MVHEAECGTPCGGKIPRGFVVLRLPAALHCLTPPWGRFPEKSSCSFGFCPNEGGRGGPCPNFSSAFHKLYIMGQFGDGEGGGRSPLPKFFGTLALRKSGISCPNFGEGGSR